MSAGRLPKYLEPGPLAARGEVLTGTVPLAEFPRLSSLVDAPPGAEVDVELEFGRDGEGRTQITGELSVRVKLRCDRCLEMVDHELAAHLDMTVVGSEAQAAALADDGDPFVLSAPRVVPAELLEDDLLLNLPLVACSDLDACPRRPVLVYGDPGDQAQGPFAALAALAASATGGSEEGDA